MSNSSKEIPTNKQKITDGMTYGFSIGDFFYLSMKIPTIWSGKKKIWRAFFINKYTGRIITDKLTNILQITDDSFFNRLFLSISLSVKFIPTNCEYKYQQKISLVNSGSV